MVPEATWHSQQSQLVVVLAFTDSLVIQGGALSSPGDGQGVPTEGSSQLSLEGVVS